MPNFPSRPSLNHICMTTRLEQVPLLYPMSTGANTNPVFRQIVKLPEDQLTQYIADLTPPHDKLHIDIPKVMERLKRAAYPAIKEANIKTTLAHVCAQLGIVHPAYCKLASRIELQDLYEETPSTFAASLEQLRKAEPPILSSTYIEHATALLNSTYLEGVIVQERDEELSYEAIRIFRSHLLLRSGGRILERPQHVSMRLAIAIHAPAPLEQDICKTYNRLSVMAYFHSLPAMMHAGTLNGQLLSAFSNSFKVTSVREMNLSILEICFIISRGGSVSVNLANFPTACNDDPDMDGLPWALRSLDTALSAAIKDAPTSPGTLTVVLEPWHAQFETIITAVRETLNRRNSPFFSWSATSLLMNRVVERGKWSLFRPEDVPGLSTAHGSDFRTLYAFYEDCNIAVATHPAEHILYLMLKSVQDTSQPSLFFKDIISAFSNFGNLPSAITAGDACSSALYAADDETACSATAAISLPHLINISTRSFNFDALHDLTTEVTTHLNYLLQTNNHPTHKSQTAALRHRAIGIGIVGLADTFTSLRLPFESEPAMELGKQIMETIYHAALEQSCKLATPFGSYFSIQGSPIASGTFDFDFSRFQTKNTRYNWVRLADEIKARGLCNSQVTAMPNFAYSSILSSVSEGFQPRINNILQLGTGPHTYSVILPALVSDLERLGLWNESLRQRIINAMGSVQDIDEIPDVIKSLYKSAWEMEQEVLLLHAKRRAPFVSQSQSIILYCENPSIAWINGALFSAWTHGLKTALYTLRRRTPHAPSKNLTLEDLSRLPIPLFSFRRADPKQNVGLQQHTTAEP